MCGGSDFNIDFYRQTKRRSRRDRNCRECGGVIKKGEHYFYCVTIFDGSASDHAVCVVCERVTSAHFAAERALGHHDDGYNLGELRSMLRECIREEPHYLVAFRAAWKGLPVPKAPEPPGRYSTVMG